MAEVLVSKVDFVCAVGGGYGGIADFRSSRVCESVRCRSRVSLVVAPLRC